MSDPVTELEESIEQTDGGRLARVLGKLSARLLIFVAIVVFVVLAADLHFTSDVAIDIPVLAALESIRAPALTDVMFAITRLGDGIVLTVIATVVTLALAFGRHWRSAFYMATAAAGSGLLNRGLKAFFARERPDLPVVTAVGYAFPSGHSMGSAATYGAIALIVATRYPSWRWPLVTGALLAVGAVGLSRAYLHVHFPSDVLAGWALGFAWALWLKPIVLGRGFRPETVPNETLAADHFDPAE